MCLDWEVLLLDLCAPTHFHSDVCAHTPHLKVCAHTVTYIYILTVLFDVQILHILYMTTYFLTGTMP